MSDAFVGLLLIIRKCIVQTEKTPFVTMLCPQRNCVSMGLIRFGQGLFFLLQNFVSMSYDKLPFHERYMKSVTFYIKLIGVHSVVWIEYIYIQAPSIQFIIYSILLTDYNCFGPFFGHHQVSTCELDGIPYGMPICCILCFQDNVLT